MSFVQRIRVRQEDNKYTKEWTDCILPWNGTAADVVPVNGGQKTMRTTSCGRYTQNQTNGSLYRRKGHSSRPSNRLTMTRPAPVDYIQADKRFVLFGYLGSQCSTKSNNPIAIVFFVWAYFGENSIELERRWCWWKWKKASAWFSMRARTVKGRYRRVNDSTTTRVEDQHRQIFSLSLELLLVGVTTTGREPYCVGRDNPYTFKE